MKKVNCIIVDDEPASRDVLKRYVADTETLNLMSECKNAIEANEVIKSGAIDLIFLDINMPLMNGLECLKEIKSHLHLKDIPVVMYTTSALSGTIEIAYRLGASLFMEKPSEFQALKNMLGPILEKDWSAEKKPVDISEFVYRAN